MVLGGVDGSGHVPGYQLTGPGHADVEEERCDAVLMLRYEAICYSVHFYHFA